MAVGPTAAALVGFHPGRCGVLGLCVRTPLALLGLILVSQFSGPLVAKLLGVEPSALSEASYAGSESG